MTRYPGYAERLRCLLTVSHSSHSSDIFFASHSRVFLSHLKSLCCRNELSPESISEAASNNGFSLKQILLILRVQRRVINKSRTKVLRKTHDFQDEKSNDKSKNRGKLSFQEQVLIQVKILVRRGRANASPKEFDCSIKRVHSKSGGVVTRREHTPEPSSGNQVNQSASKLGGRDFDWWRQADDADAEKIMRSGFAKVCSAMRSMLCDGADFWKIF